MIETYGFVAEYTYDYRKNTGRNADEFRDWLVSLDSGLSVYLDGAGMIYDPSDGVASPYWVQRGQYLVINEITGRGYVTDTVDHLVPEE